MPPVSLVSVIIPAYNEEKYLPPTLDALKKAIAHLHHHTQTPAELLVVDNGSTDGTAQVVQQAGVDLVSEPRGNVSDARNAGAQAATGDVLAFVDADTIWPESTLTEICQTMSQPECVGGAVDTLYRPQKKLVRLYLHFWRVLGRTFHMAQGATQFCRADVFAELGGYDPKWYMGEDVEFYWRMRKHARRHGQRVQLVDSIRVVPSCRRFDQWPLWKTLLLTNPAVAAIYCRSPRLWGDWYRTPTR